MAFNLEDYEPVAQRLDRWLKDCHVRGVQPKVITDLVHYLNDKCVFSASLYENDTLISTTVQHEQRCLDLLGVENGRGTAVERRLARLIWSPHLSLNIESSYAITKSIGERKVGVTVAINSDRPELRLIN